MSDAYDRWMQLPANAREGHICETENAYCTEWIAERVRDWRAGEYVVFSWRERLNNGKGDRCLVCGKDARGQVGLGTGLGFAGWCSNHQRCVIDAVRSA